MIKYNSKHNISAFIIQSAWRAKKFRKFQKKLEVDNLKKVKIYTSSLMTNQLIRKGNERLELILKNKGF